MRGNELYDLDLGSVEASVASMYLTELWREDSFDDDVFDLMKSKLFGFPDFNLLGEFVLF